VRCGRETIAPTPLEFGQPGHKLEAQRLRDCRHRTMSNPTPPAPPAPEAWQATRAQTSLATQFVRDQDDYLATEKQDIGRQISSTERELFVSCEPALAMQQQFEHLHPEFIAVHDVGGTASRKLLSSIASASGQVLQKLIIRRQGYGTPLATLEFVELPTADGAPLRIYTTEADADTASRHGLARMLLAFSRLGAVMVGDLPPHAVAAALKPLHDDMIAGPWHNRHLLLLPLASASTLVSLGMDLARGTGVNVRTTPQVTRPADAWGYINATWARVRDPSRSDARGGAGPDSQWASGRTMPAPLRNLPLAPPAYTERVPASGFAPTQVQTDPPAPAPVPRPMPVVQPLVMRPMPSVQTHSAAVIKPQTVLDRYVRQLSELAGMVSCCVFDVATGREITHAGASPGATELSAHGAELMAAMISSARTLGLGFAIPDAAITLGAHHLLLRPVPRHPGLALHAVLDKTNANLTLARLQVQRMDTLFDDPGPSTR
jgi:hypothetical protein